jgi:protein-S-isoprenylcysteine O-methyltransferase Ste14
MLIISNMRTARLRLVRPRAAVCLPLALLGGCQVTPSVAVLGAFFPDWMFCMLFALLIAVLVDRALTATGWRRHFDHWTLITSYAALCVLVALLSWLVVFQN